MGSALPSERKAIRQLAESAKEGRAATKNPSENKGRRQIHEGPLVVESVVESDLNRAGEDHPQ